jgi:hypothetical protein
MIGTRATAIRRNSGCLLLAVAAAVVLAAIAIPFWHYEYGTQRTVTFTVKSLDDQPNGNRGHQYLVFTTDGRVFKNTDSWLHGKTDSSSVQAMFTPGDTYRCPVFGFRLFWASGYPDILDGCKQVQP